MVSLQAIILLMILHFHGIGNISGNNTINNLTFSTGFTYSLGAGNTPDYKLTYCQPGIVINSSRSKAPAPLPRL
jgi:hypothetical protein